MPSRLCFALVAVSLCAWAELATAQATFTRRAEFGSGPTIGIAWGDFNRNGTLDLAIGNCCGGVNEHYINNGDGTFTRRVRFGSGNSFAVVWGDYDNDDDLDLAVSKIGQNYLYTFEGGGAFTERAEFGVGNSAAMAWADADCDGDLDLAVGNGIIATPQANRLYVNNGDGTFSGRDEFGLGSTNTLAWGDFDNDGDPDLAVGNGGFRGEQQNYLYVNNGDGTFVERAEFGMGDTAAVAWADADNDGWLDLAAGNWNAGQSYLYLNNRDGTFTPRAVLGVHDTNTVAWGDFDLDGDPDIAFGNGDFTSAEQNHLYVNDGAGGFVDVPQFGVGSTDSVAWGDFDGDGDLDLALGNEHSPPQNELWVNELNTPDWLRLRLIGTHHTRGGGYSNRDGLGARVSVYAAGHAGEPEFLRGHQQVEAKGGFSAQNAIDPTFGLPNESLVDIVVQWPGSEGRSIRQMIRGVAVGQQVSVAEPASADLNCDGAVDAFDVEPFILALLDPQGYGARYPGCNPLNADVNGDGAVNAFDIEPFIARLIEP
jgi:hypothetical protein